MNTGWTGGKEGVGRRMPIRVTRRLLTRGARRLAEQGAISAPIRISASRCRPRCRASSRTSSNPVKTWASKAEFAATAKQLVEMFHKNFLIFENHVDAEVRDAAPMAQIAAE